MDNVKQASAPKPHDPPKSAWRARILFAAFTAFASVYLCLAAAQAATMDRIIATVNNAVITESELAYTVALNLRIAGSARDRKTVESETLDGLITRHLLIQEARRLRFVEVTDQEILAESDSFRKSFGSDKALAAFLAEQDVTERELSRMLGDRLLVERFVEKKVALFVRVGREEAQAYFDGHPAEFKGKRFSDVQKNVFAFLTDRKIGQQLDQYVVELRSKANIRINR